MSHYIMSAQEMSTDLLCSKLFLKFLGKNKKSSIQTQKNML